MSFPTAPTERAKGASPEDALFTAVKTDTAMGFTAINATIQALREGVQDPVSFVKSALERFGPEAQDAVLRSAPHKGGLKIDFNPLSALGVQISRLMGTDAARPLLETRMEATLGFANCCGVIAGRTRDDVTFTIADQIEWQHSIDC